MALIVNCSKNDGYGRDATEAVNLLRQAIGKLETMDGVRAQAIAVSPAVFGSAFGITDPTEAQAFSDRWAAFLTAWNGSAVMTDFVDAFVAK